MKRILNFLVCSMLVIFSSCAHFHDDPTKSVWSAGLIVIFWIPFVGSLLCFRRALIAYNSGTVEGGGSGKGPTRNVPGRPPMYKNGYLWFGIILQAAAWIICYAVNQSA